MEIVWVGVAILVINLFIYISIFGCVGSLLMHADFV